MRQALCAGVAAGAAGLALAPTAFAAEVFGGLFAHDVNLDIASCCYETGADVEFGVRSDPLVRTRRFGGLLVYGLGSVNTNGGVDFAAGGIAWRLPLGRFYVQPGIGGAIQDGRLEKYQADPDHLYLGSRWLFEPELSLGYRIAPRWAVEGTYVHLSHGQLAGAQNPGMDDLGLRLAYRFGR